ncbi:DNA topoisomerase I [Euryarchaeota archaeon ex4484_178]|nr:MAG: DNA topoisomerase I [Euryarchaeota archaeon ex4484_178]
MNVLVIAEKRNAAQRIAKILSDGKFDTIRKGRNVYYSFSLGRDRYFIVPLRGHIIQLDYPAEFKSWNLKDLQKLVDQEPVKVIKEKGVANILKTLGKNANMIIIATDYDREGELIGVEALSLLPNIPVKRAKFSALTEGEIKKAFENLVDVNYNLATAAETRQKIDLAWGASLTRFISIASRRRGKEFLSVGRVQSPTLALIVEREKEIEEFVPKPYWNIMAIFQKRRVFPGAHKDNPFWEESRANEVYSKVKGAAKGKVVKYRERERKIAPPIPFNTTEFLSEATKLGFSAAKAMRIAEDLYMAGYISYPRTDNTVYPRTLNLKGILKSLEKSRFKDDVENLEKEMRKYPTRGKKETTDHPPIVPMRGAKLEGDRGRIYELIVRRFLATLAPDAVYIEKNVEIDVMGEFFISQGKEIMKQGWLHYYPYVKVEEMKLPELKEGDEVKVRKIEVVRKETKPPSRYTQSSLIKEMERLNLGTKSTRAEIIQKLFDRGYVVGNPIRPTKLGMAIVESLKSNNVEVVKPDMTAKLEKDMDRIEEGEVRGEEVVKESREMLKSILKSLDLKREDVGKSISKSLRYEIGTCPDGGKLIYVERKRLVVCERTNETKYYNLPRTGHVEFLKKSCPVCGLPLIKIIRKGQSPEVRCLDPKCEYNTKKDVVGKCPKCGGDLVIRQSRNGKRFIGCSNYPRCDVTYPLPQKGKIIPTGETCPYCGAPLIIIRRRGKKDWKICPNIECQYNKGGKK